MANTYVSEFTRENVRELANHVQQGLREFSEMKEKPLDLFVIAAALQQASYEIVLRSLCDNQQEGEQKIEQMKPISKDIIEAIDKYRGANKSMPTEEILGAIYASNLMVEFYAHNRDLKLEALAEANNVELEMEAGQDEAPAVETDSTVE